MQSINRDSFQNAPILEITRPVTKRNYLVTSVQDLEECLAQAFSTAASGRPGPVLVDVPMDVLAARHFYRGNANGSVQKEAADR